MSEPLHLLSLGAGVQSSTLALMAAHGEVTPMPTAAIFADTQAEPASVYRWLDWLEKQLPFPVHRVSRGDLTAESLTSRNHSKNIGSKWVKSMIPAFIQNQDGSRGIMGRQCTFNYKVEEIEKASKRLAKVPRKNSRPDPTGPWTYSWYLKEGYKFKFVIQWIGISWDERQRMKESRQWWCEHRFPLVDLRMRRRDCLEWMERKGFPKPPRSACVYCPFHSNAEWRRLKDEEPAEFERAVKFEADLQAVKAKTDNQRGKPFLHPSLIPLAEVDLSTEAERGQAEFGWQDFQNECAGMCGV